MNGSTVVNRVNGKSKTESKDEEMEEIVGSTNPDLDRIELMETIVLNKVDKLLSKLEGRLSSMEKYLVQSASDVEQSAVNTAATLKSYAPTYTKLVDTLSTVKNHLYKNHQHSLHPLTKIIDDYYAQEEESEVEDHDIRDKTSAHTTRKHLIDSIQLLDARLTDFEHHYNLPPLATHPSERLIALKETIYNYDTALTMSNKRHLTLYELPFQWRENKYIIYGYRFAKSHAIALTSLFGWHNETVNIWTHLLGSVYLLYLGFVDFPNSLHYVKYASTVNDHSIVYLFIASAVICLMFSVIWHSYTNICYLSIRSKFACFDYSGITVLITSSIITTEHISLQNYPNLRFLFVGFSILAGIVGIGMAWHPYFDKPESRIIRILFFISLSFLGVLSFTCCCFVHSLNYAYNLFSPLYISFVWYLSGVVFYGTLFPECIRTDVEIDNFEISDETIMELDKKGKLLEYLRKKPVKTCNHGLTSLWWIDWIGNSHNLWHLFVIGGILGHYSALLEMFKRAYEAY